MTELIRDIDPTLVRAGLKEVREEAGADVRILVATKYVAPEDLPLLGEAGVDLVGENRAQDLIAKQEAHGDLFEWHFIGALQSRKVAAIAPRVRMIHSVATESAMRRLDAADAADLRILVQVNVAGEDQKAGIQADALGELIAACPLPVAGLMTMPPLAADPEASRPHFARLAELAAEHSLTELSMGTSQDWRVAVSEGATIIRLGSMLLKGPNGA